jgi:amino-acid N-acetyltransferase
MNDAVPSVELASATDMRGIRALLSAAQLPITDLADSATIRFWLVRGATGLVGTVALEQYDDIALLRSLAIAAPHRGAGLGRLLLRHAEQAAVASGIQELFLLTTTAADLFSRHGFERLERDEAPEAARRSEEFRSLCPASAICMRKQLAPVTHD